MKNSIRISTAIILCIVIAVFTFVPMSVYERSKYEKKLDEAAIDFNDSLSALKNRYEGTLNIVNALKILEEAQAIVDRYYVFEYDSEAATGAIKQAIYDVLIDEVVSGDDIQTYILDSYFNSITDPYTMYHTPAEMKELANETAGNLYGIGIYVYFNPDTPSIYVNHVMKDSPAQKAGILDGDEIVAIEGVAVSEESYSECVGLVAGELNTPVSITVMRDGKELQFQPLRGEVRAQAVYTSYTDDGNYAWITITEFTGNVAEDFLSAINEAELRNVKGYIFDVRDNPGGNLNIICSVLDLLLPEGPIINVMDSEHKKVESFDSDASCINKPMTVLCNASTASAGELFTAALKDYEKATIIGKKTFGKGTMQSILPLSDGSGVRVSARYYDPPFSENYHLIGIEPDIDVEETEYVAAHRFLRGTAEDAQYRAALAELDRLTENK